MKKHFTLFTLLLVFCSILTYGQEEHGKTYQIINSEVVSNTNTYIEAFSTADMTKFRYADKSNIIEFKSGLKVELFSTNKLTSKGVDVDMSKILTTGSSNNGDYTFEVSADGKYILQKFTIKEYKR